MHACPMAQPTGLLTSFSTQVELNIVAGYGSPKDVAVYAALGLSPSQTYIVGRAVRKLQAQCQVRPKGRLGTTHELSPAGEGRCK